MTHTRNREPPCKQYTAAQVNGAAKSAVFRSDCAYYILRETRAFVLMVRVCTREASALCTHSQ